MGILSVNADLNREDLLGFIIKRRERKMQAEEATQDQFIRLNSDKSFVLDSSRNSQVTGSLIIFREGPQRNQQWRITYAGGFFYIRSSLDNFAVGAPPGSTNQMDNIPMQVQQYSVGEKRLQWQKEFKQGATAFKSVFNGQYLSVADGIVENNTQVVLNPWDDLNSANQLWYTA
jgi:hypothetical protein